MVFSYSAIIHTNSAFEFGSLAMRAFRGVDKFLVYPSLREIRVMHANDCVTLCFAPKILECVPIHLAYLCVNVLQ